ncbi:hypothetical protein CFter6_4558 [Collimonas fungivorans]|uniref:Uncharacterized protein n=1 Tax=Collimonas fungivorans TaxID=158899 RepID=A0A127PH76_9BURK|nr:hypothetical protein CFter6_4558 [Collimonas fungivorans]
MRSVGKDWHRQEINPKDVQEKSYVARCLSLAACEPTHITDACLTKK